MINITISGCPRTKKNSQVLAYNPQTKRTFITQSKKYKQYERDCGVFLPHKGEKLSGRYNVSCVYYMPTRRRVDLCNLLEATCDILVKYGVLKDDNCRIVCSHDGSRVMYDPENPRVEIEITEV